MKLYMHPVSMASRPVRLFIAEEKIDIECQRRSKFGPPGRSKSSPPCLMRGEALGVVPVVHRRDPRCFV